MESGYRLMVGIDWATEAHQVCVLNSQGRLLEQRRVEHRSEAIAAMIDRLIGLAGGDPTSIAVAIEVPRGACGRSSRRAGSSRLRDQPKATRPLPRSPYGGWREG